MLSFFCMGGGSMDRDVCLALSKKKTVVCAAYPSVFWVTHKGACWQAVGSPPFLSTLQDTLNPAHVPAWSGMLVTFTEWERNDVCLPLGMDVTLQEAREGRAGVGQPGNSTCNTEPLSCCLSVVNWLLSPPSPSLSLLLIPLLVLCISSIYHTVLAEGDSVTSLGTSTTNHSSWGYTLKVQPWKHSRINMHYDIGNKGCPWSYRQL